VRPARLGLTLWLAVVLVAIGFPSTSVANDQSGFRSHSYAGFGAEDVGGRLTAEKPESKLWHHDGSWWAAMLSPADGGAHTIHRLTGNIWHSTGVTIDPRPATKEDVLHHGNTLYVLSRGGGAIGSSALRRFTYANGAYTLDAGFPVNVPGSGGETNTIARDSSGRLWIAYERSNKVYVAHSLATDRQWSSAFVLPFAEAQDVPGDDIAAVVAFQDDLGPAVGIMWSHQTRQAQYFAVHRDGEAPGSWTLETALSGPLEVDDHINLKTAEGRVYAAVKTAASGAAAPLIRLLVRSEAGGWTKHPVARVDERHTRPITMLMLDTANRDVYVFMTRGEGSAARGIQYKKTSMDGIGFPSQATWFIQGSSSEPINDATSMKANATAGTGIVVLASDGTHYWWNRIGGEVKPPIAQFEADRTDVLVDEPVQFTDTSSGSATSWTWDFGDGSTSTERNPAHRFTRPGTYTVSLTAGNMGGSSTSTRPDYITVEALPGGGGDPSPLTVTALADAYTRSKYPTRNYGADSSLRIRAGSEIYRSHLMFTVPSLTGPAAVKLRLHVTTSSPDGGTVHPIASSWTEKGLTWDNAPALGDAVGRVGATGPTGGTVEVDLGTIPSAGTYSWTLVSSSSNSAIYASRETATPPQLIVEPLS
jgi:PKD repeat protein